MDALCEGRLRLRRHGWNQVEYEGLGIPWARRGRRMQEQIAVLRQLWTQDTVVVDGTFHQLRHSGINPLPLQRPVPIWIGGSTERALRRAVLLGDGYLVPGVPARPFESEWPDVIDRLRTLRAHAGRNESFGTEVRPTPQTHEGWETAIEEWSSIGATHISVTTLNASPADDTIDDHIRDLEAIHSALSGSRSLRRA